MEANWGWIFVGLSIVLILLFASHADTNYHLRIFHRELQELLDANWRVKYDGRSGDWTFIAPDGKEFFNTYEAKRYIAVLRYQDSYAEKLMSGYKRPRG